MSESDLATLQQWLLTVCTSPGLAGKGTRARQASALVRGSDRLGADERLGIYARGYRARLRECLKSEFRALHALVGEQVFGLFAEGYMAAHPPRSYSMFDFGAEFADFLQATRPTPLGPPGSSDALPAALARLERARAECGRGAGVETDPGHQPIDSVEVMSTPDMIIRIPATLRLLRLDFALLDALAAADNGERPDIPDPADTYYAVARTRYRVEVHILTPWQHAFLNTCTIDGIALHTACAAAARDRARDLPRIWAGLFTWLPAAVDAGMATCTASSRERRPQ